MKESLLDLFILITLLGFVVGVAYIFKQNCQERGGVAVGYMGMDCYDNVNKVFIK